MDDSWETSGIYMLTCRANGKKYIGQSKNIKRRLNEHKKNNSYAPVISKAIAKYGWDAFDKEILEVFNKKFTISPNLIYPKAAEEFRARLKRVKYLGKPLKNSGQTKKT